MRVLVTGGTGFIGAHVVRLLLAEGHEPTVYDQVATGSALEAILPARAFEALDKVAGDITDLPQILRTIKSRKIERVIHLAHILGFADENPTRSIEVNCKGAVNVFEAARTHDVGKVVWAASTAVWGPPSRYPVEYLPDDAAHHPSTIYGACKSFVERIAAHYVAKGGLACNAARFPVTYGPGRARGVATHVTDIVAAAAAGTAYEVPFPDELQNFMYVEDAARCLIALMEAPATGTIVYNVSGTLATVWDFARAAANHAPKARFTRGGGRFEPFAWKYDTSAIERDIGFAPRFSLSDGLAASIAFARGQGLDAGAGSLR